MLAAKRSFFLFVGLSVLLAGCRTAVVGSCWMPELSSKQSSGADGTPLNLEDTLGVETDKAVPVCEIVLNDTGRNRIRFDYWKVQGEGITKAGFEVKFAGNVYPLDEDLATSMDLELVGIFWEPALVKTGNFRLRLVAGMNLLRFSMGIRELYGVQSSEVVVPGSKGQLWGLDYVPVPLVGACVEAALSRWVKLYARGQMLDAEMLGLSDEFEGVFANGVAGILISSNKRASLFLGYRYFHADYSYEDDSGDSTLAGPVASLGVIF